jgi:hypothetical protein
VAALALGGARLQLPALSPKAGRVAFLTGRGYLGPIDIGPDDWAASLRITAGRTFRLPSPKIDEPDGCARIRPNVHM